MTDHTNEQTQSRVTLRDEIIAVLNGTTRRWMTTVEIAREVQRRGNYQAGTGNSAVTSLQIHRRTRDNLHLFRQNGNRVSLRTGHS